MDRSELAEEIERLRRSHRHLLTDAAEAPSLWDLVDHVLCWRVFLDRIAEPDIDVEVRHRVLVVRGAADSGGETACHALLPLPDPFVAQRPRMRFFSGILEIRIEARR